MEYLNQNHFLFRKLRFKDSLAIPEQKSAMQSEYDSLIKNGICELVPPPKGSKIVGNKQMFEIKLKANRSLDRCKSRVMTKRFQQTIGVDYTETFNPLVNPTIIRIILSREQSIL